MPPCSCRRGSSIRFPQPASKAILPPSCIFHYQGTLTPGHFKFITTLDSLLPSYDEGADSTKLILRQSAGAPDNQFVISNASVYTISVNLISLTISYAPAA